MLRSRLLLRIAALALLVGCHSGTAAEAPSSSRAETTSADSNAFPADDARTALNAASRGLRSCRVEGGPSTVDASLRFEPNGRVSKVDVTPATEPVAACVKAKLADVSVMPFDGDAVTMAMMVRL
jgi:hypothetical protein